MENNAVATDTLLNHMEDGIYKANNFSVGTVESSDEANVSIIDTGRGYTIDFEIPRGEPGEDGKDGLQGIQGEKGEPGEDGRSATITIGTVIEGETASVTNSGTETDAIFDFVIPVGYVETIGDNTGNNDTAYYQTETDEDNYRWENHVLESGIMEKHGDPLDFSTNVSLEQLRKYHSFMIGLYGDTYTKIDDLYVHFNGTDSIPLLKLSCAAFKCIFEWVDTEHSILSVKNMITGYDYIVNTKGILVTDVGSGMNIEGADSRGFSFYHDTKRDNLTDCIRFSSTNILDTNYSYEIIGLVSHDGRMRGDPTLTHGSIGCGPVCALAENGRLISIGDGSEMKNINYHGTLIELNELGRIGE